MVDDTGTKGHLIPRIRLVLAHTSAFLSLAEDTDIARTIDVDGFRAESMTAQAETGLAQAYSSLVDQARVLVRKLETAKQAIYDDASAIWTAAQACFAEDFTVSESGTDLTAKQLKPILGDPSLTAEPIIRQSTRASPKDPGLDVETSALGFENFLSVIPAGVTSLRSALLETVESLGALANIGIQQEEAAKRGIRGSIGLRDGQMMSWASGDHSLQNGHGHYTDVNAAIEHLTMDGAHDQMLNLSLEDEGYEDEDGDEMVDVSFALGRKKPSAVSRMQGNNLTSFSSHGPTSSISSDRDQHIPNRFGSSYIARSGGHALSTSTLGTTLADHGVDIPGRSSMASESTGTSTIRPEASSTGGRDDDGSSDDDELADLGSKWFI